MSLFSIRTAETLNLQDVLGPELLKETRKVGRSTLSKAGTILAKRMRQLLSSRGGPSRPGDPPAKETGALRSTVGKDRPRRDGDSMSVMVGIGVGKAKARKVAELKAQGTNVFEYAWNHEFGGLGAKGRRYPARSYARAAEMQSESEIVALFEKVLG